MTNPRSFNLLLSLYSHLLLVTYASPLDSSRETDRQTDRQTDRYGHGCCLLPQSLSSHASLKQPFFFFYFFHGSKNDASRMFRGRNEQGRPGRRSGTARVAMMVIGLVGMGSSFVGLGEITEAAMASESLEMAAQQKGEVATTARWSEKRSCPPWQLNSLETIVPENLPRPYRHRKSESVGFSDRQDAPALKARAAKSNPRCFSM